MRKIILRGCNGRMGEAISRICAERNDIMIVAGVDIRTEKRFSYPVYSHVMEFSGHADVIVDFTSPDDIEELLDYCIKKKMSAVLCSTGYNDAQLNLIHDKSHEIPIFRSGNMSFGIQVLRELARRAAAMLGEDFDIEIIERHHRSKLDAPSGTAVMLYEELAVALPYEPTPVYDRHERREKRGKNEIGLHTVRGGSIVGDHELVFAGYDEVITLSHSAGSREVFAAGAVRAALFMSNLDKPGLYEMRDII